MHTKSIFYYSFAAFTLSTHAVPLNVRDRLNIVKRSPAGLEDITGLLGGATAGGGAAAGGSATARGSATAGGIATAEGGAGAGGAGDLLSSITGGGDLLNNLPIKRNTYKRNPAGLEDITGLLGGATAGGSAAAGGSATAEGGAGAGGAGGKNFLS
ncbi:hypothetical protein Golomagni_05106 [Golovinomyces magnicellulatus]|nr:hypothetical protein Golomagni_05106 [Golovinomyces magnicellulatus]